MPKTLTKEIRRMIQATKGRFFSLTAIVAIGTAFFIGVSSVSPIMATSVGLYDDEYALKDITMYSNYGFEEADIDKIKTNPNIETIEGTRFVDVIATSGSKSKITRVHAYDPKLKINEFVLREGRLPEKENEVVVERGTENSITFEIGEKIKLSRPDDDLDDFLKLDEVEVVGTIDTPLYLNNTKENSTLSNQYLSTYMYLPSKDFVADYYTEVNILLKDSKDYAPFSEAYFDYTKKVRLELEDMAKTAAQARVDHIRKDALKEYQEGEDKYQDSLKTYNSKIASAERKLNEKHQDLVEGEQQIEQGKKKWQEKKDLFDSEIAKAQEEIDSNRTKVEEGLAQLDAQAKKMQEAMGQGNDFGMASGISSQQAQFEQAKQELSEQQAKLDEAQKQLDVKKEEGLKQLEEAKEEIESHEKEIQDGKVKLADGEAELANQKLDGQVKLEEAKAKLIKAKDDIDHLDDGEWIVLDRSKHYASATYRDTVKQMKAIAAIFPVFFLMVAALVCLTTMTRMIQEQRGQIGILRALGYTERQCTMIYLWYAGIATLSGELIGGVLGLMTFPHIIYDTWKLMYILPEMKMIIPWALIIETYALFLIVMLLTTMAVTHRDMNEVPAQLLRPKAPKLGRKVFLEKIPSIWNHLSFTWKVTIRNLFRYKKRFYMTILGVAGCTALLVTGFGIRDSIDTMMKLQFDDIYRYDGIVQLKKDTPESEIRNLVFDIKEKDEVEKATLAGYYAGKAYGENDKEETVRCEIFDEASQASRNYDLRDRKSQTPLVLDNNGVIISERLSENMNLSVGDEFELESSTGLKRKVKVEGICEMYIYHYVMMTQEYYQNVFGSEMPHNTIFVKVHGNEAISRRLQKQFTDMDIVDGISFYDVLHQNFENMIQGLDIVVLTLIISSMSLAFVVLGNLTNVNISERFREIATLKVLGFRKREVEKYIYKENNVLVFIGAILGAPIGAILHYYIMHQVEMDYVIYGRKIQPLSYAISILLTLVFGILVDMFMKKKLSNIEMVESLKSVE